jgi:hypothetical protein
MITQAETGPAPEVQPRAARWRFSTRGTALRLFLTCWLIYTLHFATNTVREIYLALALGDHLSFRVDEYANMHPDLFEMPGYGWHMNNNPGASMVAAIPYALARPLIDPIVASVNRQRAASGLSEPPSYDSQWPMAREFYAEAWRRGYDVKFGLAAFVMQAFCMAPSSALGAVVLFLLLRLILHSDKTALWMSLLYAFGTPVFFRTGFLNQNMMLGHIAFFGFVVMWNPRNVLPWSTRTRYFLGGLAGGTALLFDYSGVVLLLGLFGYGLIRQFRDAAHGQATRGLRAACGSGLWYVLGTLAPVGLLWFYQWRSFGNPFLPEQHWMPPVELSDLGYQGYGFPQLELFLMLAFDYRFGLFVSSPLMLLALASPLIGIWLGRRRASAAKSGPGPLLPKLELTFILVLFVVFWLFFSGNNYTWLQFNTGIRYMAPMLPFLFVLAAVVLARLPRPVIYAVAVLSVTESWSLAMYRDVESGFGLLDPLLHTFIGGFQLPALSTLSRMGNTYGNWAASGVSPLPLFALAGALLFGLWSGRVWDRITRSRGE